MAEQPEHWWGALEKRISCRVDPAQRESHRSSHVACLPEFNIMLFTLGSAANNYSYKGTIGCKCTLSLRLRSTLACLLKICSTAWQFSNSSLSRPSSNEAVQLAFNATAFATSNSLMPRSCVSWKLADGHSMLWQLPARKHACRAAWAPERYECISSITATHTKEETKQRCWTLCCLL